ncbi:MAG: hypothetical protein BWX86_01315 [Verrucomicrobia bacterium ADurb.Bin122]|nr:MAG: hypothetical protein BWX86_01315 [Verrucomicrobia bacterium ADurb.Bin122]
MFADVDFSTCADFLVVVAEVVGAGAEQLKTDGELLLHEPGLFERHDHLARRGAVLEADAEFLSVTLEEGARAAEIEVTLGELDEEGRALERAIAGTKAEIARAGLLHHHLQVAAARDVGLLWGEIHLVKEAGVFQAVLGNLHAHRVKHIAGAERQFPEDDGAPALGVALDMDGLDVELLALVDLIFDVDIAGGHIGLPVQRHTGVEITIAAIEIFEALRVLVQKGRGKDLSCLLAQDAL